MDSSLSKQIRSVLNWKKKTTRNKRIVALASAFVLGSTGIIMSLPASTATPELLCGLEEHQHTKECYTQERELTCMQEETPGHTHTDACYAQEQVLVCGMDEYEGHYHSDDCYDEDGDLVCGMDEYEGHYHSADCYMTTEELVCGLEETEGHTHTDDCYTVRDVLTCGKEEHVHTSACYEKEGTLISQTEDEVKVEIAYDAGEIHDGTSLSAKLLKDEKADDVKKFTDEFLKKEHKVCSAFYPYELTLSKDNEDVVPDGDVDVKFTFTYPVKNNDEKEMEWHILEINDWDEVRDFTKDDETGFVFNDERAIEEIHFKTAEPVRYALVGVYEEEPTAEDAELTPTPEAEKTITPEEKIQEELEASVKDEYVYTDDFVTVSATLTDPKAIPDSAEFVVTPVTGNSEDYQYDAYMEALNRESNALEFQDEAAEEDAEPAENAPKYTSENTLLYDIRFLYEEPQEDGTTKLVEFQPQNGSVQIQFTFHQNQLSRSTETSEPANVEVVHLPIDEEIKEENGNLTAGAAITAENVSVENLLTQEISGSDIDTVSFETDGFTVFAFSTGEGQKNTWAGSREFTIEDVLARLGDATNFAIYVEKLIQVEHLEGNIKVAELDIRKNDGHLNQVSAVIERNRISKITVNKKLEKPENTDRTFRFRVYKGEDSSAPGIKEFTITVKANELSGSLELNNSNASEVLSYLKDYNVSIYELDDDGTPIANNQKGTVNGVPYVVSYGYLADSGNVIVSSNSSENFDNYIGTITSVPADNNGGLVQNYFYYTAGNPITYIENMSNAHRDEQNSSADRKNDLVFTSGGTQVRISKYYEKDPNLTMIQQKNGISGEILAKMADFVNFSGELATSVNGAKSGTGSLSTINVRSVNGVLRSDLESANFKSMINGGGEGVKDTIKEDGYLLINVDVGNRSTYTLDKIAIDGYESGGQNEEIGRHLIINLVKWDAASNSYRAFDGTVNVQDVTAGTIFAPAATVEQTQRIDGSVIAKTFDRSKSSAETHKDTLRTPTSVQFTINNKAEETVSVKGTKTWEDNENAWAIRPESITVRLLANDTEVKSAEVSKDTNWEYIFDGLPKKDEDGNDITYTIQEDTVSGYSAEYADTVEGDNVFTEDLTNTLQTVSISGKKNWADNDNAAGKRPDSIQVGLYYKTDSGKTAVTKVNESSGETEPVTLVVTADNDWAYSFENLPKYNSDGTEREYEVNELNVPEGYELEDGEAQKDSDGNFIHDLTNKEKSTDFKFTKIWKNEQSTQIEWPVGSENQIEVTLFAEFAPKNEEQSEKVRSWKYTIVRNEGDSVPVVTAVNSDAPECAVAENNNNYEFTFNGLPISGKVNEQVGIWKYYVKETSGPDGYTVTYFNGLSGASDEAQKEFAENGEFINNKKNMAYELPKTGGSGTNKYLYSGLLLVSIALLGVLGTYLKGRRRVERRASK